MYQLSCLFRICQVLVALLAVASIQAQEKPTAGHATPQAAFAAYAAAQDKQDWKTSWSCLTPQQQDSAAFEAVFELGMHEPDYQEKYFRTDVAEPAEPPTTVEARRKLVVSMLRDKFVVYAAVNERAARAEDAIDWKEPLRKVIVEADRAHGVVTRYVVSISSTPGKAAVKNKSPYDSKIYFQKTPQGWLLDEANPEEAKREAATSR